MNKIELMLVVKRILVKLFGESNVLKVVYSPSDGNKVTYTITIDNKKFIGCVFYNARFTVKDVRNILFAYKKREIKALNKEVSNVDSANEKICTGVHQ